ncbi:REP-associated tyrosine transposase [Ekhidna sp.]
MSEKYKFHEPSGIYFTTTTVAFWVDLFTKPAYKHLIVESLRYCQKEKGLKIHAWCLMSSHLHMIISSEDNELSSIMADFKKHTSKQVIKILDQINESRKEWLLRSFSSAAQKLTKVKNYKVWHEGNHPILLDSTQLLTEKLDYIHMNPVEDESLDEPSYYWYSSARNYEGKVGLIKVDLL